MEERVGQVVGEVEVKPERWRCSSDGGMVLVGRKGGFDRLV